MDILAHSALLTLLQLEHINLVYPFLTGSKWLSIGFLRSVDFRNRDAIIIKHVQRNLHKGN